MTSASATGSETVGIDGSSAVSSTIGLDFGSTSVRAVVVDTTNGTEIGVGECPYPSGDQGVHHADGDPLLTRQHPGDYLTSAMHALDQALSIAALDGHPLSMIRGVGVGTTGSTPIPVSGDGTPLAMMPAFRDELDAMAWLWKDHTAHEEAARITASGTHHLDAVGGDYSSEWYWAKLARFLAVADPAIVAACAGWVELADYVVGALVGNSNPSTMTRGICPAGHKALYLSGVGLPSGEWLDSIQPGMSAFRYDTVPTQSDQAAGFLTNELAAVLELPQGIPVVAGSFDAHVGAVGAGVGPGVLVKIIGTSTCDCTVAPFSEIEISGLCGSVPGSVVPGMIGLEAGQSAVGDIFAWFTDQFAGIETIDSLTDQAADIAPGSSGLLALDWHNGNRSILVDPQLTGLIVGLTLTTRPAEQYRAYIEATAFGARRIIEQFESGGVPVERLVMAGGVAKKNPLLMQIYSDVTNRPIEVAGSRETVAVGGAMLASVAAGIHPSVEVAQTAMLTAPSARYEPRADAVDVYGELYSLYLDLHDSFGSRPEQPRSLSHLMKELMAIRDRITTS